MRNQPLEVNDFSGGLTDNYVDAPQNRYQKADNFFITPNKKLLSRFGSKLYDAVNFQTPNGNNRVGTLINYNNNSILFVHSGQDIFYINTLWQKLIGPSGYTVFTAGNFATKIAHAQWNRHLFVTNEAFSTPMKIYRDNLGVPQVRTAGLPALATSPVFTPTVGTNNYLYAAIYQYAYFVDTVEYQDFGPTAQVSVPLADAPNINPIVITAIPVLTNGVDQNWDTAAIKLKIYRTINNGDTFYYVGEVTNGTTTFNDTVSDATLQLNATLYTTGGILDNDPPPLAKFVHITNGTAFYAHIKEGTEIFSNRVQQSIQDDPDSCPVDFFIDVEEEIDGISSVKGVPIILCQKSIYRLDGFFDELGRGGLTYQKINDTAGCVSHNSILQTIDGIFWAGNDGFYFSDGYRVQKISDGFNDTYKVLVQNETQKKNITGAYDEDNKRIIWCVQTDPSSQDNDTWFMLDLRWGIRDDSTFTTASGGASFAPSSLVVFNKELIRGDKRGYVFKHNENYLTDPRVDVFALPSVWGFETIVWDYRSASMSFGTSMVRKWVPKMSVSAKNVSNLSLQIRSNNDDNRQVLPLSPIRFRGNIVWGDIEVTWGDDSIIWGKDGIIDEIRRFPAKSLRCDYKQIQMTNAYVNVTGSDALGSATSTAGVTVYDSNVRYIVLDNLVDFSWPLESVGYYISFERDGYVQEYAVLTRTGSTITVVDADATSPVGAGLHWMLRGKPKNEVFNLLAYVVHFQPLTDTQKSADYNESGGNV